jgi:hypothetical protein
LNHLISLYLVFHIGFYTNNIYTSTCREAEMAKGNKFSNVKKKIQTIDNPR